MVPDLAVILFPCALSKYIIRPFQEQQVHDIFKVKENKILILNL